MDTNKEIINDLNGLIHILNDGKEGYLSATEVVHSGELKNLFLGLAQQREQYATELKNYISLLGGVTDNETGGVLAMLHRTWIDLKQALSSKEDEAILGAIETGEKAAIEKFDKLLADQDSDADHIRLLQKQRTGILEALKQIETYHSHLVR